MISVFGRLRKLNGYVKMETGAVAATQNKKVECYRCGGNHYKESCPGQAADFKCERCGRTGHVKKVCRELAAVALENDRDEDERDHWLYETG
jgi:late competence protein required for DNA uptake (superfamily II DNA/RNA helicase)